MNYTKINLDEWSRGSLFQFYIEKMRIVMNARAIIGNQPENFFDVSCLPWVKYQHFDVHVFDEGKFLAPVIT